MCDKTKFQDYYRQTTCTNLDSIAKKEAAYLQNIMAQINTIYKTPTNRRRGLIDGLGTVAKTLFGTMDANDEKHINEQLSLLQNSQQTIQHAVQNQIKVLNATIAHIDEVESIIERNEKLLQKRVTEHLNQEEINEHFTIITAIVTDLIRDVENIIEYLTYIRKGAMHPKLMPIDSIITQLREAAPQLPQGLYFPFKVHAEDWLAIEEHTAISAYCDQMNIYTILRFPLIAKPTYDIINVIEFPIPSNKNVYTYVKVNNKMIIVDKEKLKYSVITEDDLQKCNNINAQYICEQSLPIYRVNSEAPCEIQMYTQRQRYQYNCNIKHYVSTHMKWIALQQTHAWLYSTAAEQTITIQCDEQSEDRKVIKNTGKITLTGECKLITTDMTIETKETIYKTNIQTYLPEVNLTFSRDNNMTIQNQDTLENITQHRVELMKLKANLEDINNDLRKNEQNFFTQKQFIYPMASSGIITIIIIIIVIWIIMQRKNKNKNRRQLPARILDDEDYSLPRSILKRSQSTRF